MTDSRKNALTTAGLFIITSSIALLIYLRTVDPGLYWGDTAEFQRVALTLDLAHPTGYPLYLLLGRLWIAVWPFGSVAGKMNALSAVFAALTVGVVSVLIYRVTRRTVAAVLAGLVLAVSSSFWSQAVIAEVYTLHTLLTSLIFLTLLWHRPWRPALLPLTAFLLGLGVTHHRMAFLLMPGIAAYLVCEKEELRELRPSGIAAILLAFLLGLSPYLLPYTRADWPTFGAFLTYLFPLGGRWFSIEKIPERFPSSTWPLMQQQMGVGGVVMALVGLVYSYRSVKPRSCGPALLLGISWLAALLFLTIYTIWDISALFPHFQVINAILIGLGLAEILSWLERPRFLTGKRWLVEGGAWLLVIALVVLQGRASWQTNDSSGETYAERRSEATLAHVQSHGLVVTAWGGGHALLYLQQIEGLRPDLHIMIDDAPAADKVQNYLDIGRPTYFWGLNWLDLVDRERYSIASTQSPGFERDLFRVFPAGSLQSDSSFEETVQWPIGPDLVLESYRLSPWPLEADELAELRLCWTGVTEALHQQTIVFEIDREQGWFRHEFQVDDLDAFSCSTEFLVLPPVPFADTAPGALQIRREGQASPDAELTLDFLALAPGRDVSVDRLMLKEGQDTGLMFNGASLLGLALDDVTSPGISFPIDAYWQVSSADVPRPTVQLQLRDPSGTVVDQQTWQAPAAYPPDRDRPSGVFGTRYWLTVPRRATAGLYTIHLGAPEDAHLIQASSLEVQEPNHLRKQPDIDHPTSLDFADGRILLAGYGLEGSSQELELTLAWRSLDPVDQNWMVFVHIVDQTGSIVAQNDSFPANGLRWTDTWRPREYIVDRHTILLPEVQDDAEYAILVGMYDPQTGVRVPIRIEPGGGNVVDSVRLAGFVPAELGRQQ